MGCLRVRKPGAPNREQDRMLRLQPWVMCVGKPWLAGERGGLRPGAGHSELHETPEAEAERVTWLTEIKGIGNSVYNYEELNSASNRNELGRAL